MFDLGVTLDKLPLFLHGAWITFVVSLLGALLGIVVGVVLLLLRRQPLAPLRWFAAVYVSFVRGTPLLVQIFLVYYALPGLTGIDLPAFTAGVLALSLNSGAFVTEIVRGSLTAVPDGQFEAARALGLPRTVIWGRVIMPQVFRLSLPPLMNEFTMLVKASPLLSVITVVELTRTAQTVMNVTYRPIEAFATAAVIYFVMLFVISSLSRVVERRMAVQRA
ncbi:MAG: amino acid ABC transporter permease [Alphaproteobacteria bacterium]|nr:amino acid ABC transporter permease [Alphaproteobacteria bacterium]